MNKLKITVLGAALLGLIVFVGSALITVQSVGAAVQQTNQNNANQMGDQNGNSNKKPKKQKKNKNSNSMNSNMDMNPNMNSNSMNSNSMNMNSNVNR